MRAGAGAAFPLAILAAALLATAWLALQMGGPARVVFLAIAALIALAAVSAWRQGR